MSRSAFRLSAVTALLALGCNQVFGLDPVASHDDATGPEPDADVIGSCAADPTIVTRMPSTMTAATPIEVGGVTSASTGLWAVATSVQEISSQKDGYLIRRSAAGNTVVTVRGAANDQLWRIAGSGDILAVGITRSGLNAGADGDDGLMVRMPAAGGSAQAFRLDDADSAGNNVRITAVTQTSDGWIVAGDHTTGVFVAWLDTDLDVVSAKVFVGPADLRVRQFAVSKDSDVAMVATRASGSVLIRTTSTQGDHVAQLFPGVTLSDVAWIDGDIVAVGRLDAAGVSITLDPTTNVLTARQLPGRPLLRVIGAGDHRILGGHVTGGETWVGVERGECVSGFDQPGVTPAAPIAGPLPMALDSGIATLVGSAGASSPTVRFIPVGPGGASTCGTTGWAADYQPLSVSPTSQALTENVPALTTVPITLEISSVAVTPVSGC